MTQEDIFTIPDSSFVASDEDALRFVWLQPDSAQDNVLNWRIHPPSQTSALNKLIFSKNGVGWAGVVLVNDRRVEDGWQPAEAVMTIIDGHDRHRIAQRHGQRMPALVGHWSPAQENMLLATFDPIGALAQTDAKAWSVLLKDLQSDDKDIALLLTQLEDKAALVDSIDFGDLPAIDSDQAAAGMKDMVIKVRVKDPDQYEDLIDQIRQLIEGNGYAAELEK